MEYDLKAKEGSVNLVINGKVEQILAPDTGFGECHIKWVNGKIVEAKEIHSKRFDKKTGG